MVFENHTAGERAEGDAVGGTSRGSSQTRPTSPSGDGALRPDGLVVSEWTATATYGEGRRLEWDGIDVFPFEDGLIVRKDVYSSGHAPRVLSRNEEPVETSRPTVHLSAPVPAEVEADWRRLRARRRPEGADGIVAMLTVTSTTPTSSGRPAAPGRRQLRGRGQQRRPRGRRRRGVVVVQHARRPHGCHGRARRR